MALTDNVDSSWYKLVGFLLAFLILSWWLQTPVEK